MSDSLIHSAERLRHPEYDLGEQSKTLASERQTNSAENLPKYYRGTSAKLLLNKEMLNRTVYIETIPLIMACSRQDHVLPCVP